MKISAVLIVRDEEAQLPGCLESLRPLADELVVVDTGSTDQTVACAREFTSNVHTFEWQDDFALARNFSLEKATGDYILVADADQQVVQPAQARHRLETFAHAHSPNTLGTVVIVSGIRDGEHALEEASVSPKFFQRGRFIFEGAIHEQLVPVAGEAFQAPTGLQYLHGGYEEPEALLARSERNRRILLRELEQCPDDEYYLYQLGKTDFCRKEYAGAAQAFEKSLENMHFSGTSLPTGARGRPVSEDVLIDLLTCLAYARANLGQYRKACDLLEQHRAMEHPACRWADFPHALGYLYLMLGDVRRSRDAFMAALQLGSKKELVRGTGSFRTHYHLGLLAEAEGNLGAALGHYLESLQACPDHRATISRCVDLVTERRAALPPEIWQAAHPETLVTVYAKRLLKHLSAEERDQAAMLLAAAKTTAPGLTEACAAAFQQLQATAED